MAVAPRAVEECWGGLREARWDPIYLGRKKGWRPKLKVGDRTGKVYPGSKHSF